MEFSVMFLIIIFLGIIYIYISSRQYLVKEQFIADISVDNACPKCRNPDCPFLKTGVCPFAGTGDCMMRRYMSEGLEGFVVTDPQDLDKAFLGAGEGPYTSWPGGVVSPPPYADSPMPRPMCIPGYNKKL
jgi:hypothetical protein